MNPQNDSINQENQQNATPINLGNRKMVWVWIVLIGGFVIIVLLATILFYQSKTDSSTNQQTTIKESNEKISEVIPADEKIDEEVANIDLGNLESDFKESLGMTKLKFANLVNLSDITITKLGKEAQRVIQNDQIKI